MIFLDVYMKSEELLMIISECNNMNIDYWWDTIKRKIVRETI